MTRYPHRHTFPEKFNRSSKPVASVRKANRQRAGISLHGLLPAYHATDNYVLHRKALRKAWASMQEPLLAATASKKNSNAFASEPGQAMREVLSLGLGETGFGPVEFCVAGSLGLLQS